MRPTMYVPSQSTRRRFGAEPEVSIQVQGNISLSPAARALLNLEVGGQAVLFWYGDARQIGIRLFQKGDPLAAGLRLRKDGGLSCSRFFRRFEIDLDKARGRYVLGHDPANGLYLFTLPRAACPDAASASIAPLSRGVAS